MKTFRDTIVLDHVYLAISINNTAYAIGKYKNVSNLEDMNQLYDLTLLGLEHIKTADEFYRTFLII